ncbi:MAG: biopolymer transporter ExbD [Ignavibacteriae bacterium HGW-Ignavibacteriae-3]|nr:MAG: biopolymer transporter ExbD [Ignavibacteriae bacterium HGW-Ignavibacteriae-3]
MSGGAVGGSGGTRKRKGSKRKPKKRMNIHLDMTPLVDIAFLLLTFFMLTTVFRKPQTLEINLPPDKNVEVKMAESNLLQIRCDEQLNLYWNVGFELPKKMQFTDLKKFLSDKIMENPKFVVLVKIDRKAKYHAMIDIIDELGVAKMGKYALAPMTEIDKKEMSKATL